MDTEQTLHDEPAAFGDPSHLPHGEPNLTPLAQLKRMQRVLYADVVDPTTEKRLRPQCACAWEKLEGRKAALTMKAAPKPVDVLEYERQKAKDRAAGRQGEPDSWKPRKRGPASAASSSTASPEPTPADPR